MNTKQQYKTAMQMAWPSVLESFFISLVGMIDTITLGTLSSYAIAAIGLTTQPRLIGLTVFFGINIALSSFVARRRGEDDKRGANEVFLTATILALIACLILTFFMLFFY